MQIIRGLNNIKYQLQGGVATIGNFDGVHLGHQQLLQQTANVAKQLKVPSIAITFEPQPAEFFKSSFAPARLTRLREKFTAITTYAPVDYLLCLRFDSNLANLPPNEFIRLILAEKLAIRRLITGEDFRFGSGRKGNIAWLKEGGAKYGYEVQSIKPFLVKGQRVSSTRIRETLALGQLDTVKRMLGRNYQMIGQVVPGDQRGRQLGFPTANIFLKRKISPLAGVYAVMAHGINASPVLGVANVGTRPTVDGTRSLLEVYLLDFDREIYGQHMAVEFIAKIRPEYKFPSLEALKKQIAEDVNASKDLFAKLSCSET